jgi:transcriptional regulator with XRE-family HTH domain
MALHLDMRVGLNLRRLRERRKMSADELSRAVGVSREEVHKWESGEARMGSLSVFAAARTLDADVNEFFR